MRIFFAGDIVGRSGREALAAHLPGLKERYKFDVVVVNGENATHGLGITEKNCKDLYAAGVDCITTGNHIWSQREAITYVCRDTNLIRPQNFPPDVPGKGVWEKMLPDGRKIAVINLMGRVFMDPLDCPFRAAEAFVKSYRLGQNVHAIFVDFHAEATSEKMFMGHFLDGKVSAVIGTHTHVPTADHMILEHGTAYMTDAGMTGDYDSVIGVRKDIPMTRFVRRMPGEKKVPASGEGTLCGAIVDTDDKTGLAKRILPLRVGGRLDPALPDG